jgi:hypothetical protein
MYDYCRDSIVLVSERFELLKLLLDYAASFLLIEQTSRFNFVKPVVVALRTTCLIFKF